MSEAHIETVQAVYERWSEGDFHAAVEIFDPHVVLVLREGEFGPEFLDAGVYVGPEAVAEYTRSSVLEPWKQLTMEAEEILVRGDTVVVGVHQRAVGSSSGFPAEAHYFTLWSFRGDKVIRIESFRERADAIEAAGLRE